MTIHELHIKLDLQYENKTDILEDIAFKCNKGYLFVDSLNGYCYLFDKNGNEDNVKKIKSIGNNVFWNCKSLKSIVIPDSVRSIRNDTFAYCENLESIVIPNSVKSIEYGAFAYCKSLKSIVIPDLVRSIGYRAFYYCKSLKSLIFKGKTIDQVKSMNNYPFGIENKSIIKCI